VRSGRESRFFPTSAARGQRVVLKKLA
jgi:hypothetical protein